jgi:RNA polymerase sigma-70 factor (ECF subfamily)
MDFHTAQDVVQGFFAALIEKRFLDAADPERGRFRTFLLTAFKRYASKERVKEQAKKRGGDRVQLSLDFEAGEERYRLEPQDEMTPERLYERGWALALLEKVLRCLEREYGARDDAASFAELRVFLVPGVDADAKVRAAERLGLTQQAFRVALHRLRKRYRQRIEAEILETVAGPEEVTGEIQHLMEALS